MSLPPCPKCGEKELWCPGLADYVAKHGHNPTRAECIDIGLDCLNCGARSVNFSMLGPTALSFIQEMIPIGSAILELGSGEETGVLSLRYNLYSIEHNPAWLNRYPSQYIYAPLTDGWYCTRMLRDRLPAHYSLLLIDGPPSGSGQYGRAAMIQNLDLFNLSTHILIDDINRPMEMLLARAIAHECERPLQIFDEVDGRQFGYVAAA